MHKFIRQLFVMLLCLGTALPALAADLTNFAEDQIIGAAFRGGALTWPTTWHIALLTAVSDKEAGTVTESACGLGRASVANSSAQWNATVGGNGTTANTNTITYGAPSSDCGQVVAFGFYDAASAGNLWIVSTLTTAKTINNGDAAPTFAAGALTFQIDN